MPGSAGLVGGGESVASGLSDGVAAACVFVVGGDVADRLVEADRVVVVSDAFEFGGEDGGVVDGFEVGVLAFDVSPEALDPGLVGWGGGPPEVLGDGESSATFPAAGLSPIRPAI